MKRAHSFKDNFLHLFLSFGLLKTLFWFFIYFMNNVELPYQSFFTKGSTILELFVTG